MPFSLNRRQFLTAPALLAGPAHAAAETGLKEAAKAAGLLYGAAFDARILTDSRLSSAISRECSIATVENALKFDWLRPRGPTADFTRADNLVEHASRSGIALRGTALVWNDYPPPWLKSLSLAELRRTMEAHIEEVAGRYAGRLHSWDVVNEPFAPWDRQEGHWRKGPWFAAFGPSYVIEAFRRARAADPHARLTLNEAFCEQDDSVGRTVRPALLALVRRMADAGVRPDTIGLQAHLKPHLPFDDAAFAAHVRSLAETGAEIYLTELDVDDRSFPADAARRDALVAARYRDFLGAVLEIDAVKAVITWGLADRDSWYRELVLRANPRAKRLPRPLPLDEQFDRKPAWHAIRAAFLARAARRGR